MLSRVAVTTIMMMFACGSMAENRKVLSDDDIVSHIKEVRSRLSRKVVHVQEGKDRYCIELDLKRYDSEHVKVIVRNGYLLVRATKQQVGRGSDGKPNGSSHMSYSYTFKLPSTDITAKDVLASWNDGVLRIVVPILDKTRFQVKISG